ncbi:hypothetical protein HDU96_006336 [Phlyctochytrium bullatum]|nr:hypothetical protein HDU96_006336 [Phlyctochytrium bullatum]
MPSSCSPAMEFSGPNLLVNGARLRVNSDSNLNANVDLPAASFPIDHRRQYHDRETARYKSYTPQESAIPRDPYVIPRRKVEQLGARTYPFIITRQRREPSKIRTPYSLTTTGCCDIKVKKDSIVPNGFEDSAHSSSIRCVRELAASWYPSNLAALAPGIALFPFPAALMNTALTMPTHSTGDAMQLQVHAAMAAAWHQWYMASAYHHAAYTAATAGAMDQPFHVLPSRAVQNSPEHECESEEEDEVETEEVGDEGTEDSTVRANSTDTEQSPPHENVLSVFTRDPSEDCHAAVELDGTDDGDIDIDDHVAKFSKSLDMYNAQLHAELSSLYSKHSSKEPEADPFLVDVGSPANASTPRTPSTSTASVVETTPTPHHTSASHKKFPETDSQRRLRLLAFEQLKQNEHDHEAQVKVEGKRIAAGRCWGCNAVLRARRKIEGFPRRWRTSYVAAQWWHFFRCKGLVRWRRAARGLTAGRTVGPTSGPDGWRRVAMTDLQSVKMALGIQHLDV